MVATIDVNELLPADVRLVDVFAVVWATDTILLDVLMIFGVVDTPVVRLVVVDVGAAPKYARIPTRILAALTMAVQKQESLYRL